MSVYISVRGWLACDTSQLAQVKPIISDGDPRVVKGWSIPNVNASWTNYVMYGADIRDELLPALQAQLQTIAALTPETENEYITGLFFVSREDSPHRKEWLIKDGSLHETDSSERYDFLDR